MKTINTIGSILTMIVLLTSNRVSGQLEDYSDSSGYLIENKSVESISYGDAYTELFIRSRVEAEPNDLDIILVSSGQKNRIVHVMVNDSLVKLLLFYEGSYVPVLVKDWVDSNLYLSRLKGYYQMYIHSNTSKEFYDVGIYRTNKLDFRILIDGADKCGTEIRGIPELSSLFQAINVYAP